MPPRDHALLSASGAGIWTRCPPSARLGERLPDTGSPYAAAGTLAHAIAEWKARCYFLEPVPKRAYNTRLKQLRADPSYDRGMDAATDAYLDHLKALALAYGEAQPLVALEVRVDYSDYAPEGFGTADAILIGGDRMCVADYKNGAGVLVEAQENPQMMLYALGALNSYAPIYGDSIRAVSLSIVQPNAGGVRTWETTVDALREWGEKVVRPAAALAWEGQGNFHPGAWCRFCRARARCAARARQLLELEGTAGAVPAGAPEARAYEGTDVPLLSDAQVGEVLTRALELEAWVKDLKDYALSASLAGRTVAGWKTVEGRGSRDWVGGSGAAFAQLLERGVAEALLYERRPVSVAGLEKALGNPAFAQAAQGLWEKSRGKPALVPESDKRPAYLPAQAAFQGGTDRD